LFQGLAPSTIMVDLYELERRLRDADRDLRAAENRAAVMSNRLSINPVSSPAVEKYRAARREVQAKAKEFDAATAGLRRVNDDISVWTARADRIRRRIGRREFWTGPVGVGLTCSAEAIALLVVALVLMASINLLVGAIVFVALGTAAITSTVLVAGARRRSLEPEIDYLQSEVDASERGAATYAEDQRSAERRLRLTRSELDSAQQTLDDLSRCVRPLVEHDEAQRDLEGARRRYDQALARCQEARAKDRLRLLRRNWRGLRNTQFERFVQEVFECLGYRTELTKVTGDQGIDVIATRNGVRWAIQCKGYAGNVGNDAVQQAYTGRAIYRCDRCMVVTNSGFTASAREAARHTECVLVDGRDLPALILGELRL
jgi:hypothetical protein